MTRVPPTAHRLLEKVPRVYIGPDAERALLGERGVLLGAKRPEWIDVLAVDAHTGGVWNTLVARRYEAPRQWEAVGLSLPFLEFQKHRARWLRELVPGDAVVTENGISVHLGDVWRTAKIAR